MTILKASLAAGLFAAGLGSALAADLTKKAPAAPAPAAAPFFFVNDNTVSLSYQFKATDPGVKGDGGKTVLNFTHFDVWAYGTNFFTVDVLKSGKWDPSNPCAAPGSTTTGCAGSTEIYGLFRSSFGLNQILGTKTFSMGPLSNVSLLVGGDANTQNIYLAPAKRDVIAGVQFNFDLPYRGHLNIAPAYYKEWGHNAYLVPTVPDGNTDFDGTWAVETNYSLPLGFLPEAVPLTLSGFANFYGPKGNGTRGYIPTATKRATEFNSEQKLSLDLGRMVGGPSKAHLFDVWVAYRYWQNKFGLDHVKDGTCIGNSSCTEKTLASGVSVKF